MKRLSKKHNKSLKANDSIPVGCQLSPCQWYVLHNEHICTCLGVPYSEVPFEQNLSMSMSGYLWRGGRVREVPVYGLGDLHCEVQCITGNVHVGVHLL